MEQQKVRIKNYNVPLINVEDWKLNSISSTQANLVNVRALKTELERQKLRPRLAAIAPGDEYNPSI